MEQVSPTRTELLTRKAQIRLAEQGAELLRGKREALVREFLAELQRFTAARDALHKALVQAAQSLMKALAIDGPEAVASAALVCRRPVRVDIEEENIWGTKVASVRSDYSIRLSSQRGYSATGVSARIDESADEFETVVDLIIKVAPVDRKLRKLAEEIRKTSRRVNALEQRLLPSLAEQVQFIRNALDQREREDIFRLKRLKKKRVPRFS